MNERYLFRGKQIDSGKWFTGYYLPRRYSFRTEEPLKNVIVALQGKSGIADLLIEVDPATIGQCTGLRDKNGTPIFEGDVVSSVCDGHESEIYRVAFENYGWELRSPLYDNQELCDFVNGYTALEVIGNIHDKEAAQ